MSIVVSDQTLRDGEQQVGIIFSPSEKRELAYTLFEAGINFIALMPATMSEEYELTKELCLAQVPIIPDVPLRIEYVEQAKTLGVSRITLFASVSDILLSAKGISRDENIRNAMTVAEFARRQNLTVDFACEDASRADVEYLCEFAMAIEPYVDYLVLCDTVGCLQPSLTKIWVQEIRHRINLKLGIHCHNDLGLAVDNTVSAVIAGATLVSGTFTGIGERAGNAALEQVLTKLNVDHDIKADTVDYAKLNLVCQKIKQYAQSGPANPLSKEAFYTQTGIHVFAMLQNPFAYSIFPNIQPEIWYGKYSGVSNFEWLFERILKQPQPQASYIRMRDIIKQLSVQKKRSFSAEDIINLYTAGHL